MSPVVGGVRFVETKFSRSLVSKHSVFSGASLCRQETWSKEIEPGEASSLVLSRKDA